VRQISHSLKIFVSDEDALIKRFAVSLALGHRNADDEEKNETIEQLKEPDTCRGSHWLTTTGTS
jgi:hypothetical protein